MKGLHLLGLSAATSALLLLVPATANAQRASGMGYSYGQIPPNYGQLPPRYGQLPTRGGHRHRPGLGGRGGLIGGGVWVVEREVPVYVEREVVREVLVEAPPPPPPREPHVIGKSYASLPGGCMKMIDQGVSYYGCSGEWYLETGSGSSVRYKAVKAP
jgi:hypothetical protein